MERPFPAYRGEAPYVFVSYAHTDAAAVYPELERLNDAGFNVWYDEGISPGAVWRDELAQAIEACRVFLVFVTPGVNTSDHVMKEVNFALDSGRPVLAVHLQPVDLAPGLRLSLSDRQAILKYERSETDYTAALGGALNAPPRTRPAPQRSSAHRGPRRPLAIAAIIVAAAGIGWWTLERTEPTAVESPTTAFTGRPAVAVLPFANLSGNPDDEYFSEGLTEDLIDELGRNGQFPVIASSSATFRDAETDLRQIARQLGARYLVRGSARRSADAVRVNVGLFDAESGVQIWSERYDRGLADIFDVQDDITNAVVNQMYPQLDAFDQQRALRKPPEDMTAWDLAQKGWWHFRRFTESDNREARATLAAALSRDPAYANAAAGLAMAHYQSIGFGWTDDSDASIDAVVEAAEQAVVLDSHDPLSQHALGHAYALTGNHQGMIDAFETSLALNPSSALVAVCAGEGLAMAGEWQAAIEHLELALRLSPRDPAVHWTYHSLALAHFAAQNYSEAIHQARQALAHQPEFTFALRTLAASLAQTGQLTEAREVLARARKLDPEFTLAGGRRVMLTGLPGFAERYIEGLRLAGQT